MRTTLPCRSHPPSSFFPLRLLPPLPLLQEFQSAIAVKCGSIEDEELGGSSAAASFVHEWCANWAQGAFKTLFDEKPPDASEHADLFQGLSSLCAKAPALGKYCTGPAVGLHDWFTDWVAIDVSGRLSQYLMDSHQKPFNVLVQTFEMAKATIDSLDKCKDFDNAEKRKGAVKSISTYMKESEAVKGAIGQLETLAVGGTQSSRVQFLCRYHRCVLGFGDIVDQCKGGSAVVASEFTDDFASSAMQFFGSLETFRSWFSAAADQAKQASEGWDFDICSSAPALDRVRTGRGKPRGMAAFPNIRAPSHPRPSMPQAR